MRVVAIADSDSYVKWAASLLGTLPRDWDRQLLIIETPVMPSAGQREAALSVSGMLPESIERIGLAELSARLSARRPDAVVVGARGPVARVLIRYAAELPERPVIVSGLPGISVPATRKALMYRLQSDLFVLHSRREIREFTELARENDWDHRFALATLPFIEKNREGSTGTDLVFAAQAIVPRSREDRIRVARLLRDAALAEPSRRVVVKVRAMKGERQTHDEEYGYPELLNELGPQPLNLQVSDSSMSSALNSAEGLLTVSSTAALEAIARGIPVIALDIFGVSDELINPVFVASGVFAGEAAVIAREFRHPQPEWFADNYFHDPSDNTLTEQVLGLVSARTAGLLPVRSAEKRWGGRLGMAWDRRRAFGEADRSMSGVLALAVGLPVRRLVLIARGARRLLNEQLRPPPA